MNAWQGLRILDPCRVLAGPWRTRTVAGVAVADFFGACLDQALAEARKRLSAAA